MIYMTRFYKIFKHLIIAQSDQVVYANRQLAMREAAGSIPARSMQLGETHAHEI